MLGGGGGSNVPDQGMGRSRTNGMERDAFPRAQLVAER